MMQYEAIKGNSEKRHPEEESRSPRKNNSIRLAIPISTH
jgi:hypothetical protein